jgi:hypothetical protein
MVDKGESDDKTVNCFFVFSSVIALWLLIRKIDKKDNPKGG